MRGIIQDPVSHTFFEGPVKSIPASNNFQNNVGEKSIHSANATNEVEISSTANTNIQNAGSPNDEGPENNY